MKFPEDCLDKSSLTIEDYIMIRNLNDESKKPKRTNLGALKAFFSLPVDEITINSFGGVLTNTTEMDEAGWGRSYGFDLDDNHPQLGFSSGVLICSKVNDQILTQIAIGQVEEKFQVWFRSSFNDVYSEFVIYDSVSEQVIADINTRIDTVEAIAKGANQAKSYLTYSAFVSAIKAAVGTNYKTGQGFYIGTVDVPDLWIYSIESTFVDYTYTSDQDLIDAISANTTQQIGYFKIAFLETQKVDLSNYYTKSQIDTIIASYYTKTQIDTLLAAKLSTSGTAAAATILATARTLTLGLTGKTFNGSANVAWTLAEIGALALTGGTMTGLLDMYYRKTGFSREKYFGQFQTTAIANQKLKIQIPNVGFTGKIEVEIIGSTGYGRMIKTYLVRLATGSVVAQKNYYSEADPLIQSSVAMSDLVYSSGFFNIPISFSAVSQYFTIIIRTNSAYSDDILTSTTISSIYTTDTTVYPTPKKQLPDGTTVDGDFLVNGNINATGEVSRGYTSDERLKENIQPLAFGIYTIKKLRPITFRWNKKAKSLNENKTNTQNIGLVAQEVQKVLPGAILPVYDKYLSIDYAQIIPVLIKAIQEQQEQIETLTERINESGC